MLVSLIAFSQKNTKTSTTDSIIVLPKAVAREVVKDIIRKDSCQQQLDVVQSNLDLSLKNNELKDSIISNQNTQLEFWNQKGVNYETMLTLKDLEKKNLEMAIKPLKDELKKAKRQVVMTGIGAGVVVLFLGYLLVK